jgi:uncharacterized protein (DUF58 family)
VQPLAYLERISARFAQVKIRDQRIYPSKTTMRKVFVLPRRHGYMVGFSTLGIFAIAIRIENNMLLLLAVALFILFLLSLVWAGRNMAGICVKIQPGQRLIAGRTQDVMLTVYTNRPRYFVLLRMGAKKQRLDLSRLVASATMTVQLDRRGQMTMPPMMLESDFPFGLARCWAWVSGGEILVAPAPISANSHGANLLSPGQSGIEDDAACGADSLADWTCGTPQSRIHWKRFAATGRLLVKTGDQVKGDGMVIDYAQFKSLGHERALSAMCAAVLAADKQQSPFVVLLPSGEVKSPNGQAGEALDALALA